MAYNPRNPNGQATMANSEPVVIASNQSAIPITDNAGSITVDGTIAVTQSGTWDEVGINDSGNSITVDAVDLDIRNLVAATDIVDLGGNALTSLQLIDDIVYTDDTSTHATGTSKGVLLMAAATPTDAAVNANDIGALAMTLNRELLVQVNTALPAGTNNIGDVDVLTLPALPAGTNNIGDVDVLTVPADPFGANADAAVTAGATGSISAKLRSISRDIVANIVLAAGTNAIGKLAANSGIDIGDVDVTSIIPGTGATNLGKAIDTATGATDTGVLLLATRDDDLTTITPADGDNAQMRVDADGALWVTTKPNPTEGASTINSTSSDGGTALTNTAQAIKASAGCLYGYFIYNPNATAQYVQFYNTASGSVTVGTTNPLFMLVIPATSGANMWLNEGALFTTAMSWAATSTAGGNGAPSTALEAVAWYK